MKPIKSTLIKNKTLIKIYIFIATFWGLFSCSAYDLTNTSQVYSYPKPVIEKLAIENDSLKVTISLNMSSRDDFEKYVIFATAESDSFDTLTSKNLNEISLIATSSLPFFIADTSKPGLDGGYVNDLTYSIPLTSSIFQKNSNYKIIVLAWGENGKYASAFNNNGWVFSPFSQEATFHYRQERKDIVLDHYSEKVNNKNYGFNLENGKINLVNANVSDDDPLSSTNQLIFYLTQGDDSVGMFFPSNGSVITPLGFVDDLTEVGTVPSSGYLEKGRPIPINRGNLYAIKNQDNTFMKIHVRNIGENDSRKITITLDVTYSIIPNETNF